MRRYLNLSVRHAEYRQVLAAAISHHVAEPVNQQRDVIVAIVGGTLLTLVLSRPRLRWLEQITAGSSSHRLWAERALTIFSFAMGGYAWTSLFLVLHRQLGPEAKAMITGAAAFIVVYAGLVHFEPFVAEWRSGGGAGAAILYFCVAVAAVLMGTEIALVALEPSLGLAKFEVILFVGVFGFLGVLAYKSLKPRSAPARGEGDRAF